MATLLMIVGTIFLIIVVLFALMVMGPIVLAVLTLVVPAFFIGGLFSGWETGFSLALSVGIGAFIGLLNAS